MAEYQLSTIVSILTSLLTGGVLVLFIESQHVTSFVYTKYETIMAPFMHKLSCFVKVLATIHTSIEPQNCTSNSVSKYKDKFEFAHRLEYITIMGGRDYQINHFSAKQLDDICEKINDIWYYGDRKKSVISENCSINTNCFNNSFHELLHVVFNDFRYDSNTYDIHLFNEIAGKFYSDIYQPIRHIPAGFELWKNKMHCFKKITITGISTNIIGLGIAMFCSNASCVLICFCILSMLLFCISLFLLIRIDKHSKRIFR